MNNLFNKNNLNSNFALRKIPVFTNKSATYDLNDDKIDKIKILELSAEIDKWEQEILFASNGFYSLKGTEPSEKEKDYISELKRFIEAKISDTSFSVPSSKKLAHYLKQNKISAVKTLMDLYSQNQLNDWVLSVCEDALNTTIQKAVLYKNNPLVVNSAYINGLKILEIIAQKENWNKKLSVYKKKQFISDFYLALIQSFIQDKDITAYQYFDKYKNVIDEIEINKIEKNVNELRINIIAYNWASEVFSYNLEDTDFDKELNNIKDSDIKIAAKQFYSDLKKTQNRKKILTEKEKNINNWKEIIDISVNDIDRAALYIDYSLNKDSINSKKSYIKQLRESGCVKSDINLFLKVFDEIFSDFHSFKDKDISDYRCFLSDEDFQIIYNIQKYNFKEFEKIVFDRKYLERILHESDIKNPQDKYEFIKLYFISTAEYKENKNENPNSEIRQKIIDAIFSRLNKKNKK